MAAPLRPVPPLPPGTQAPEFRLHSSPTETLSLADVRGSPIVLAFYREDWSPSCCDQMSCLQEFLPNVRALAAVLAGISIDGIWSHLAFRRSLQLDFPLLSDSQPRGAVARTYHVLNELDDRAERALFVLDARGRVVWSERYPSEINPGVHGILTALEALAHPKDEDALSSEAPDLLVPFPSPRSISAPTP